MKTRLVNLSDIAKIAPKLTIDQLFDIFALFGLIPVFEVSKKKKGKRK